MLLIARETIGTNQTRNDVVRETSFTPGFFATPGTFGELMAGQSRRIVVLTELDVCHGNVRTRRADPVSMSVLAAVAGLAHNLGMTVCAGGVEDRSPFDFLKAIDCDKMQGFLISEAVIPSIIRRVYPARQKENTAA